MALLKIFPLRQKTFLNPAITAILKIKKKKQRLDLNTFANAVDQGNSALLLQDICRGTALAAA